MFAKLQADLVKLSPRLDDAKTKLAQFKDYLKQTANVDIDELFNASNDSLDTAIAKSLDKINKANAKQQKTDASDALKEYTALQKQYNSLEAKAFTANENGDVAMYDQLQQELTGVSDKLDAAKQKLLQFQQYLKDT